MILEPALLKGAHVRLEPVTDGHERELRQALDCDPANWDIQYASAMGDAFVGYWKALRGSKARISFLVRSVAEPAVAGTSSYLFIDPRNRTLEIGGTWLRPEFRGTQVNPEMKLLMLEHAFAAGAERVQFTVDARNRRSRRAMLKLGAVQEGVVRRHLVTWTGHKRDSVLFSILADEWPEIRQRLLRRLGADTAEVAIEA
jgi:RimJ/RimL family protein N-acetyltransferase